MAKDIREHFRTDPDLPYHYMTDLDFATVANFEERNLGVTGIRVSQNPAREYTYGAFAAHILGYVGKPDNQNEHLAEDGVTPYETVGRHGIEAIMDAQLQGEPGSTIQRVSSQGYTSRTRRSRTPARSRPWAAPFTSPSTPASKISPKPPCATPGSAAARSS